MHSKYTLRPRLAYIARIERLSWHAQIIAWTV